MVRSITIVLLTVEIVASALASDRQLGDSGAPQTAEEFLERGERWAGEHKYDRAIAAYDKALELRPEYAEAFNDRGHAYYWKGETSQAIADFTQAIQLRPNYPNAFNNRGAAYLASGESQRAIPDFTRALELKPAFRNAYVNRANAFLRLGHIRQSLDDFHSAGMYPERAVLAIGGASLLVIGAGLAMRALRGRAVTKPKLSD